MTADPRRSAITRAADEDDAHDEAKATAEHIAGQLADHLATLAAKDGVSADEAQEFADAAAMAVALAALEAAQPITTGVVSRAHGGISSGEARRLQRITRTEVSAHRTERRAPQPSSGLPPDGAA